MNALHIAYLIGQFPKVNHTYVLREIQFLRKAGIEPSVASVSAPDRALDVMDPAERFEAERAFYVKRSSLRRLLTDHAITALTAPRAYVQGLWYAARMGRLSPLATLHWLIYFAEAVLVGRWMKRSGLRHLHCHFASSVGLMVSRIFSLSVSNTIHGPAEFANPAASRLREKVHNSQFVVAISHYGRSQLMCHSDPEDWDRIEVCHLGVEAQNVPSREPRPEGAAFEILSVGRLSPEKGFPVLIEAVRRLAESGRPVRLRIAGGGPAYASLNRRISTIGAEEYIRLEGPMNPAAVAQLYRQVDAFALASFAEGLPVVLMEAMSAGLPCVATRITGVPELICDGVNGVLVFASDVEGLTAALGRLADSPDLCRQLGQAARHRVLDGFDAGANARRLADIFRRHLVST